MPTHILYGAAFIAAGIGGLWYDRWLRKRGKYNTGSIVDAEGQNEPIPRNGETTFGAVLQVIAGLALGVGAYQIVMYFVHVR